MKLFYFILLLLGCSCQNESSVVHLEIPEELEAHLAMIRLKSFMHDAGYQINQSNRGHVMQIELQSSSKGDEGYVLKRTPEGSRLTANDPAGLHYGVQEIIDQLNQGKALENLQERSEKARFSFRAIKYNLPWDSYRRSPALQLHMDICRDIKYWEKFLNMMLENRFNTLTLWNLHPFNFLVKPASFPKATGFSDLDLKEWQKFWHQLFQMAKQRGIETYLVNWNIFVSPDFAQNYGGAQYSQEGEFFTDGDTSEIVKQYTRECVTQVINQYPDLTGLGITLGEGMGGMTPVEREEWLLETIIEGMRQANRPVKFIHRVPLSANKGSGGSTDVSVEKMTRQTLDSLSVAIEPIYIELKFNWSHGHSTPDLVKVHGGPLSDAYWNPAPSNYKLNWMIRNEDFFCLRWGQPDFIRQHIQQNGHDYVSGYFVGSECYIPARDYFSKEPGSMPWEYAFERQWLFYQTWGRLLYNPGTNDQVFIQQLAQKYPDQPAADLFEAWKQVSQTPLRIASFWNGTWDFTLYSEGFMARQGSGTSLISLENLIDVDPL
ncbi:MAG: glycoside hydrolase family 20 zincin-like fold domain-containing protein, partial [Candidatus Cyclobacteriaceae bacterium M3_2C_046]